MTSVPLPTSFLPKRSLAILKDSAKDLGFWEILNDQWNPNDNPNGFLSLGIAENTLMHDELVKYINSSFALKPHSLTYGDSSWGSKALRSALAAFLTKHLHPLSPIKQEHVVATAGITNANEMLAFALADDGDGFLLGQPFYTGFVFDWACRAGVKTIQVNFGSADPLGEDAAKVYEDAILKARDEGQPVKGLFLSNPHNPLGRCYSVQFLKDIMRICQKYNIHLISDEIYALTVWENPDSPDATTFTSVLSIDSDGIIAPELVHVLWGVSKDFGANGLRLGCIVDQHNEAFRTVLTGMALFNYPSAPSDSIVTKLLSDAEFTEAYITQNQTKISEAYKFAVDLARKHSVPFTPGSNAAFFLWLDLRSRTREGKNGAYDHAMLLKRLAEEKVWVTDGMHFGATEEGWFRLVFTHPKEMVEEGINRLVKAL